MAKVKLFDTMIQGRELTAREQDFLLDLAFDELWMRRRSRKYPITFGPVYGKYWNIFKFGLVVMARGSTGP